MLERRADNTRWYPGIYVIHSMHSTDSLRFELPDDTQWITGKWINCGRSLFMSALQMRCQQSASYLLQFPNYLPPSLLLLHSLPFAYPVRMFRCFLCRGCSPHPCYFLHSLPLQDFTKPKPEATRQCTHSTPQHTQHTLTWQLHSPGKL